MDEPNEKSSAVDDVAILSDKILNDYELTNSGEIMAQKKLTNSSKKVSKFSLCLS